GGSMIFTIFAGQVVPLRWERNTIWWLDMQIGTSVPIWIMDYDTATADEIEKKGYALIRLTQKRNNESKHE
ncbi:MAG: hypothetical protein EBX40_06605, partial [Gammaproteobacteria bacterium]|nr:hypothetical protein [Gammaproteobacteria bacterium]